MYDPPEKKAPTPRKPLLEIVFKPRNKPPNLILSVAVTTIKMIVVFVMAIGIGGIGLVMGIAQAYIDTTPTLDLGAFDGQAQTSFLYDMTGARITDYMGTENRIFAPIDEIPEMLQNAFIAIEDNSFKTHNGIDVKRIVGAFLSNMTSDGSQQGGSTITQQLIKNTMLDSTQSYKRKIQEARLAMELEKNEDKDTILEYYLNTIHLGENSYGVKAAALDYFGKELADLTLREMACLAGINKNPYSINPRRNYIKSPERRAITDERTATVLRKMYECGFITEAEKDAAIADAFTVVPTNDTNALYPMPYAVEYAIYDAALLLCEANGLERTNANRQRMEADLRTKGYHIYTTIDPAIQGILEDTLYNWTQYPRMRSDADAVQRQVLDGGRRTVYVNQPQAAAAVLDWRAGEYRAIVGGRDAPTGRKQLNRAYDPRVNISIGSSIKPLTCYTPAMDKGLGPASPMLNLPAPIQGWTSTRGYPLNFSGGGFGLVPMREALVQSLNIVAAHLLLDTVTLDDAMNALSRLGIDTSRVNKFGSDLALGTGSTPLVQVCAAYGTLANKGEYQRALAVTRIEDADHALVLDAKAWQRDGRYQVYKPGSAYMMIDMMSEACRRGTGTRAASGMKVPVAGKTGTNSDHKAVFFAGVTPYYAGAVWVGHDENLPLNVTSGAERGAAPIWNAFMKRIHAEMGLEDRDVPIIADAPETLGLFRGEICALSGLSPSSSCFERRTDWMNADVAPEPCNLHELTVVCTTTMRRPSGWCPPDTQQQRGVMLVPSDHPLARIDRSVLAQYAPDVRLRSEGLDGGGICEAHTEAWYLFQQALPYAGGVEGIERVEGDAGEGAWEGEGEGEGEGGGT